MQFIITKEELDQFVSKERYDALQEIADRKTAALDAVWATLETLPDETRREFVSRYHELLNPEPNETDGE